jgi:hypothetical protein
MSTTLPRTETTVPTFDDPGWDPDEESRPEAAHDEVKKMFSAPVVKTRSSLWRVRTRPRSIQQATQEQFPAA